MKRMIASVAIGNPRVTFTRLGYHPSSNGSFERRLGRSQFPRFHVYLGPKGEETEIAIHMDQKPHTYTGFSAHLGEYEGDTVERELDRIITMLYRA